MCKESFLVRNKRAGIAGQREFIPVPCGKCKQCISSRILSWIFRLEHEIKISSQAYFVTLTYDENHVPLDNPIYEKGYPDRGDNVVHVQKVLKPRDLTLYLKLLRKRYALQSKNSIRYFAVGEYGTKFKRPHYHIIMLNCDNPALIQDAWGRGHVDIRPLRSIRSVAYCLKYLYKSNVYKPAGAPAFSRMSKGLGANYITAEVANYHKSELSNVVVSTSDGIKLPLPKYFKDKIYDSYERYRLTNYLQKRVDERLEERVSSIMQNTGKDEESILYSLMVEPFLSTFDTQLVKPSIF